jgi:hypothetical protein
MFELNATGRWCYGWESGATKAQRSTQHVFELYVLRATSELKTGDAKVSQVFETVAATQSPSFTLLSFRRAPALLSSSTPSSPCAVVPSCVDRTKRFYSDATRANDSTTKVCRRPTAMTDNEEAVMKLQLGAKRPTRGGHSGQPQPHTRVPYHSLDATRHQIIVLDLVTLVSFLQHIPWHYLQPLRNHSVAELITVLSRIQGSASTEQTPPPETLQLMRVVLELIVWLQSDATTAKIVHHVLVQARRVLLHQSLLYQVYGAWLEEMQTHINTYLSSCHTDAYYTLPQLAHGIRRLYACDPTTSIKGFEAFVAQVREFHLVSSNRVYGRPSLHGIVSTVCRINPSTICWRISHHVPSALLVLWLWRQLETVELTIETSDDGDTVLFISSQSECKPLTGSRFVMDGKPRWLRRFPSGLSTSSFLFGSHQVGDYVAVSSDRQSMQELRVNCYSWPVKSGQAHTTTVAYCWRWCLAGSNSDEMTMRMTVDCGVMEPHQVEVETAPLQQKLQDVREWTTICSIQCQLNLLL